MVDMLRLVVIGFVLAVSFNLCSTDVKLNVQSSNILSSVSPHIFGVNHLDTCLNYNCDQFWDIKSLGFVYPVNRWGGNSQTRYSYLINKGNSAVDWYFISLTLTQKPGYTKKIDQHINETRILGSIPIIQVPMIGWTAKTTTPDKCWGSSIAKYGQQDAHEDVSPDAGNGKRNNQALPTIGTILDPNDCSQPINETFIKNQITYLQSKYGTAQNGGVKYYELDNEIMLWDSTHFDVHPQKVTYDEAFNTSLKYSKMIRSTDPNAIILSPSTWGYCDLFYSAADGCSAGSDRSNHGNIDYLEWLVTKAVELYKIDGFKLFDYLNVHFYPQAGEYSDDESTATQLKRMETDSQHGVIPNVHRDFYWKLNLGQI